MTDPDRVTIEAFGHSFRDLLVGNAQNLRDLEDEGVIYANFVTPEMRGGDQFEFARYRVPLKPAEIVEYVEAHLAQQEFFEALNRTNDFAAAVTAIRSEKFRQRVVEYGEYGTRTTSNGQTYDNRGCTASFLGPHLEALTCGLLSDRYERLPALGSESTRDEIVIGCLQSIEVAARRMSSRSHGRPPLEVLNEYDVQDLAELVLRGVFVDLVREEWTPKRAGAAKRIDLVVPSLGAMIECKFVRDATHGRKIADELRVDFETYHDYEGCRTVFAYVYDPKGYIADREQFIEDLSGLRRKRDHEFTAIVIFGG